MPLHVDEQVEVAARCPTDARLAFTRDADAGAVVDPGGDVDRNLALLEGAPFARTGGARIGDDLARSLALRAAALDDEEALLRADLARAAARRTGLGGSMAGRATPGARITLGQRLDRQRLLDPGERFLKTQLEVVAKVGTTRGIGTLGARIGKLAEDRRENVGEALETSAATAAEATRAGSAILEGGLAKAVIGGAFLRILEAVISLADRLETLFLVGAAAMPIGMAVHRQAAIAGLDRLVVGGPLDLEQLVIIVNHDFFPAASSRTPPGRRRPS